MTEQKTEAEQKTEDGVKGIGGWLILPLLGLIISPVRMAYQFVTEIWANLNAAVWAALTSPESANYHVLWGPLIIFEVIGSIAIFAFGLWVLACFLRKSRLTPRMFIVWVSSFVVLHALDLALSSQIPAIARQTEDGGAKDLVRAIIAAAIWIPYFLKSKRVANTFVE